MTQFELADKVKALDVNFDRAAIAKIETGRRCVLDVELAAMSRLLGVRAGALLVEFRRPRARV